MNIVLDRRTDAHIHPLSPPWVAVSDALDTCKLASLGWASTPVEQSIVRIVEECIETDRNGSP
ncbi:MAG: hypothetical protein V5A27_04280 [Halapricum sp.]